MGGRRAEIVSKTFGRYINDVASDVAGYIYFALEQIKASKARQQQQQRENRQMDKFTSQLVAHITRFDQQLVAYFSNAYDVEKRKPARSISWPLPGDACQRRLVDSYISRHLNLKENVKTANFCTRSSYIPIHFPTLLYNSALVTSTGSFPCVGLNLFKKEMGRGNLTLPLPQRYILQLIQRGLDSLPFPLNREFSIFLMLKQRRSRRECSRQLHVSSRPFGGGAFRQENPLVQSIELNKELALFF